VLERAERQADRDAEHVYATPEAQREALIRSGTGNWVGDGTVDQVNFDPAPLPYTCRPRDGEEAEGGCSKVLLLASVISRRRVNGMR
jgi:hypothetical protein